MSSLYLIFVFRHVTVIMKKTHIYHRHIKGFNSHGSYFAQRPSRHPSPKIITSKDLIVTLATSRKDPSDTRRLRSSLQRFNSHASLFYTKVIQTTRRLRSSHQSVNSHASYFAQSPSRHPSPKIITSKDLIVTLAYFIQRSSRQPVA